MAFWGAEVKPGKPYTYRSRHNTLLGNSKEKILRLRITQATLGHAVPNINKSVVQCNVGNRSPVLLCSLLPEKSESCSLELEFEEADDVVLSVLGPRSVHLSGYYLASSGCSHFHNDDDSESFGEDIANTESEPSYSSCEDKYESDFIDDDDVNVVVPPEHNLVEPDDEKHLSGARKYRHLKKYISSESDDVEKPSNRASGHRRLRKKYKKSESENDEKPLDVMVNHESAKKCQIKDYDNDEVGHAQLNDPKYVQLSKFESESEDETKVLNDFFIENKSVDMVTDKGKFETLKQVKKLKDDTGQGISFGRNNTSDVISATTEKPSMKKKNGKKGKSSADVSHVCAEKLGDDATLLIEKTHKSEGASPLSSISNGHSKCVQDVTNAANKNSDEVLHASDALESKTPGYGNNTGDVISATTEKPFTKKKNGKKGKSSADVSHACAEKLGEDATFLIEKAQKSEGAPILSSASNSRSKCVQDVTNAADENSDKVLHASDALDSKTPGSGNFHHIHISSGKYDHDSVKKSKKRKLHVNSTESNPLLCRSDKNVCAVSDVVGKNDAWIEPQRDLNVDKLVIKERAVHDRTSKSANEGPASELAKDQLHYSGGNDHDSFFTARPSNDKDFHNILDASSEKILVKATKKKKKDKYHVNESDSKSGKEDALIESQINSSVNKEQVTVENGAGKDARDLPTSVLAKDQLHESRENANGSAKNSSSNKNLVPDDIAHLSKKKKRKDKSQLDKPEKDTTCKDPHYFTT